MRWIYTDSSPMDLIHAHIRADTREVDECIHGWTVPSLPEYPSCSYHHLSFSVGELLSHREDSLINHFSLLPIYDLPDALS